MNSIFLNQTNTGYFDLNQDQSHERDPQQQGLETSPFYPPSIVASSIRNLHLEKGLGMSANYSVCDQSLSFDQFEASKNMFFNLASPSYGDQMASTNNCGSHNQDIFIFKQQEDQEPLNLNNIGGIPTENGSSLRWMSSKMRMMRKMINSNNTKTGSRTGSRIISASNKDPDHGRRIETKFFNNGTPVCSDCNTTKTPLWRSGPQGPKTLCNACGIRQRKARKASMEAAAAAAATNSGGEGSSSTSTKATIKLKVNKEKKKLRATSNNSVSQHINKKQTSCNKLKANNQLSDSDHNNNNSSTTRNSSKRQMIFEEFAVNLLRKNAAFHRMFPQDEEEGALLLMALSYGLIQN